MFKFLSDRAMPWLKLALTLVTLLMCAASPAHARRVALVIGNTAYTRAPVLPNAINDARAIREKLASLGFEIMGGGDDLTHDRLRDSVGRFVARARGADIALFFFAGHGVQDGRGINYLVPVDVGANPTELRWQALQAQEIVDEMASAAKVSLVFLDACRNNEILRDLTRALPGQNAPPSSTNTPRGLARMTPTHGNTLIAFATAPNTVAADGRGRHSPYTAALLEHLDTPGVSIQDVLARVRNTVVQSTDNRQRPEFLSALQDPPVLKPVAVRDLSPEGEAAKGWELIKATCNRGDLDQFQRRHLQTTAGDLARSRITDIDAGRVCAVAVTPPRQQPVKPQEARPLTPLPQAEPTDLARPLQTELQRVGCLADDPDGKWGPTSRSALTDFYNGAKIASIGNEPSEAVVAKVRSFRKRVCPCGSNQIEVDGRCTDKPKPKPKEASLPVAPSPGGAKAPAKAVATPPSTAGCFTRASVRGTCTEMQDSCKRGATNQQSVCERAFRDCMQTGRWVYRSQDGSCTDWGTLRRE